MIKGTIRGQSLRLSYPTVVSDTVAYLTAEFSFLTDGWNGLDKWAQFRKGEQVYSVRLKDDKITEEDHLDLEAGEWQVSVFGTAIDGEMVLRRITTKTYPLTVAQSGALDGEPLPITPPSTGEKILMTAEQALAVAQGVRADADAGAFQGEKGEKGDPTQVFEGLGDSRDGVMSQRATTKAIEGVTQRVEQLECAAQGVLYRDVEASGEAYSVEMPEGVLPYAALSMVGGRLCGRERNLIPMPYNGTIEKLVGDGVIDEMNEVISLDGTITITGCGEVGHLITLVAKEDAWYPGQGVFTLSGSATNHAVYLTVTAWKDGTNVISQVDAGGSGATLDLTNVAYDFLTVDLTVENSEEAIECVVCPQFEAGTVATEFEPFTLKHAPVTEVVSRGRSVAPFAVTKQIGCKLTVEGNRFSILRKEGTANAYIHVRTDSLAIGQTYTIVIKVDGIDEGETSEEMKAYASVMDWDGFPLGGGNITGGRFVKHLSKTFVAATSILLIGLSNTRSYGDRITYSVELLEGEVTEVPFDFRDVWEARYEIPAAVVENHGDSWGYSVGDAYSYLDLAEGKYYARAKVRPFADGDFDDAAVLTDGVQTVCPCDEVYDVALPEPYLQVEDGGAVRFENGEALPVPYRLQYQVKV